MNSNIAFALAESDFLFRKLLSDSICRNPYYHLKYMAGNGYELIRYLQKNYLNILLIDLYMPVLSGTEAIKIIRQINPSITIFCWSSTFQQDVFNIMNAQKNVIYCEKDTSTILNLINKYLTAGISFYPEYIQEWAQKSERKIKDLLLTEKTEFTTVELSLMKLSYEGLTNKEIAEKMILSKRTVDTYINRLTSKLGLRTKTELIKYTVDNGIYNTML